MEWHAAECNVWEAATQSQLPSSGQLAPTRPTLRPVLCAARHAQGALVPALSHGRLRWTRTDWGRRWRPGCSSRAREGAAPCSPKQLANGGLKRSVGAVDRIAWGP
jgi:hypothetical protein